VWGLLEIAQAHAGARETIGFSRQRIDEMKQSAMGLRRAFAARRPITQVFGAAVAPLDLKLIPGPGGGRYSRLNRAIFSAPCAFSLRNRS